MKLEDGKHYRMRNGETVGPVRRVEINGVGYFQAKGPVGIYIPIWESNGKCSFFWDPRSNLAHDFYDIVEEIQP